MANLHDSSGRRNPFPDVDERQGSAGSSAVEVQCGEDLGLAASVSLATERYQIGDFDAADAILASAMEKSPGSRLLAMTWGWAGQTRASATGSWAECAERWRTIVGVHFPNPDESINVGIALERSGATAEAEDHYAREVQRFPDDPRFLFAWAAMADAREDRATAARRWRAAALRFPDRGAGHAGEARNLAAMGMELEADLVLTRALADRPSDPELLIEWAALTAHRGDLAASVERWRRAIAAAPERAELHQRLGAAIAGTPPQDAGFQPSDLMAPEELLLSFESLGDNCELGMVQRLYGAEPVGLFRFTTLQPEYLVPALASRFEGIGSPEQLSIEVLDGEYVLGDRRFKMWSHTFIKADPALQEETKRKMARRMSFLRRNLIHDLENRSKIFVYKSSRHELDMPFIKDAFAAVSAYSANALLVVRAESPLKPSGTVEEVAPYLLLGYVDRLSPPENATLISGPAWLTVCRRAHALWQRRRALDNRTMPTEVSE